jgi:hypothetical protein
VQIAIGRFLPVIGELGFSTQAISVAPKVRATLAFVLLIMKLRLFTRQKNTTLEAVILHLCVRNV